MAVFVAGILFGACQPRQPSPVVPEVTPPVLPPPQVGVLVPPSRVVTNELQQVTYTFELPRPSIRGYIIQESRDGKSWSNLGRSTATNYTMVTFVDASASSGKRYRVCLP